LERKAAQKKAYQVKKHIRERSPVDKAGWAEENT